MSIIVFHTALLVGLTTALSLSLSLLSGVYLLERGVLRSRFQCTDRLGRRHTGGGAHIEEEHVHNRRCTSAVDWAAQVHLQGRGEAKLLPRGLYLLVLHEAMPHGEGHQAVQVQSAVLQTDKLVEQGRATISLTLTLSLSLSLLVL